MIKHKVLAAAATGVVGMGLTFATSGVASAAPATFPNSNYGFDGTAHLIVGGGSTTLFRMAQSLANLWEDTAGCASNNSNYDAASSGNPTNSLPTPYPQSPSSAAFNQCSSSGQSYGGYLAGGNFDGSTVAIATSAGSSTGIASLNGAHSTAAGTYAYAGTQANLWTSGTAGSTLAAVNQTDTNVTLTNGSPTITDASATQADVGTEVSSSTSGFPSFATVTSVSGSTVTMSANFTGATASTYSVTYYDRGTQTSNGYGTVDFDLSSRAAKTSGGNCATPDANNGGALGDELGCDTFWGVASDGVGIYTFDSAAGAFTSSTPAANVGLSAQDMFDVFNCDVTTWGQLPEWQAASAAGYPGIPDANAPIVPWSMNSTSGTYGDFNSWIATNATGVPSGWSVDNGCDRQLTTGGGTPESLPLENDFKPLIVEAGANEYNSGLYTWPAVTTGTPPFTSTNPEGSPYTSGETFPAGVNPGTTVAAGSNGATLTSLVGGSLDVATVANFPATGSITVPTSSGTATLSYTSTTASPASFNGLAIVSGTGTATVSTGTWVQDAAGLDSPQNPTNWIWFGSFGLLSEFPYLAQSSTGVTTANGVVAFASAPNAVSNTTASTGTLPSQGVIQAGTYPIERILSIVTKKADADCPLSTTDVCNFTQGVNPGPTNGNGVADIQVNGGVSGKSGAIREFVRFLCRAATGSVAAGTNVAPNDPYTGVTMSSAATGTGGEIDTVAVEGSGFRPVPVSSRSPGSPCDVKSFG